MKKVLGFKIKRVSDGLFSTGGRKPEFKSQGYIWARVSDIKHHLTNLGHEKRLHFYDRCVLVTLAESDQLDLQGLLSLTREKYRSLFSGTPSPDLANFDLTPQADGTYILRPKG